MITTRYSCASCDAPLTQSTHICVDCNDHFRRMEWVEPRADHGCRKCGVRLPAGRTQCDTCWAYDDGEVQR